MNVENYSERVHIARTHELASESQPYERVPNCLDVTREVRTNFEIMLSVSVKSQLQTQFRLNMYVLYIKIIHFTWRIASQQPSMFLIALIKIRYK